MTSIKLALAISKLGSAVTIILNVLQSEQIRINWVIVFNFTTYDLFCLTLQTACDPSKWSARKCTGNQGPEVISCSM